jgi:hypothetical protein
MAREDNEAVWERIGSYSFGLGAGVDKSRLVWARASIGLKSGFDPGTRILT